MLAVTIQDTVAATLVNEGTRVLDAAPGHAPPTAEVWVDA